MYMAILQADWSSFRLKDFAEISPAVWLPYVRAVLHANAEKQTNRLMNFNPTKVSCSTYALFYW